MGSAVRNSTNPAGTKRRQAKPMARALRSSAVAMAVWRSMSSARNTGIRMNAAPTPAMVSTVVKPNVTAHHRLEGVGGVLPRMGLHRPDVEEHLVRGAGDHLHEGVDHLGRDLGRRNAGAPELHEFRLFVLHHGIGLGHDPNRPLRLLVDEREPPFAVVELADVSFAESTPRGHLDPVGPARGAVVLVDLDQRHRARPWRGIGPSLVLHPAVGPAAER